MKKGIIVLVLSFLFLVVGMGQNNANCYSAHALEYNDTISYEFDTLHSLREIGPCAGAPIKKHWFSITGNGKVLKLRYSISYVSDPAIFILSGPCDTLVCIQGGYNERLLYFQTEIGTMYHIVFTGDKVYGNPEDEPGGEFYLKTTSFEPNCIDSLAHVLSIDGDTTLSVIDYINACPIITESVTFKSGSNIVIGRGFEVSSNATFECVIENCAIQN